VQLFQKRICALEAQRVEIDRAVETLRAAAARLTSEISQAA
jgi:hypothetical protein